MSIKAHQGQWYADRATRDTFCVINVDEMDGIIDVRDSYGDIDEFDFDEWASMDLEVCIAPTGWVIWSDDGEEEDTHPAEVGTPSDVGRR